MSAYTGTGRLIRLALRRDRVKLPVWILAISGLTAGVVASVTGLYASEAERVAAVTLTAGHPVSRIFDGPASGTDIGAMAMVESYLFISVLVMLMSAQAVIRHTRAEEETERAELIGAGVVGRYAPLAAALVVAVAASLLVGAAAAGAFLVSGHGGTGALAAGGAFAGIGIAFAAVAAVTAQVFSSARASNGATVAVLGVAFLLRAIGDAFGEVDASGVKLVSAWPSWLSPMGWGQQIRPYAEDNLALLWLFVGFAAALVGVAFALVSHRDLGAGLVATRRGPPAAGRWLRSPLGLAWRLQRGVFLAWAVGLLIFGATFGSVGESAEEIMGISEQFEQAIMALAPEGGMVDLFFTFVVGFFGIAAAGFTVQTLLRMRAEESTGRLEPVLATAVGRSAWLGSHVLIAGAGTVALLVLSGLAGAVAYVAVGGDWAGGFEGLVGGSLAQAPAALALGGFVLAVFALVPRWASALGWTALAVSLVVGQLGVLLGLPQAVLNASPFTHVPAVPAQPFSLTPVLVLFAAAAAFGAAGVVGFRRRDLAIGA